MQVKLVASPIIKLKRKNHNNNNINHKAKISKSKHEIYIIKAKTNCKVREVNISVHTLSRLAAFHRLYTSIFSPIKCIILEVPKAT